MTPLIDVTFLLLTYFMLASHFATNERPDMKVPDPEQSQAIDKQIEEKVIVNVLYTAEGSAPKFTYGAAEVPGIEELGERLSRLGSINPQVQVILRADRRIPYGEVRKVMEMIAGANLGNLQVVAELDSKG